MRSAVTDVPLIVGWDILQHVVIEIAGAKRELVLRASIPIENSSNDHRESGVSLESNLVLLREPVVRLRSGDTALLFLLDTGANATDVTPGLVRRLGLGELPTRAEE